MKTTENPQAQFELGAKADAFWTIQQATGNIGVKLTPPEFDPDRQERIIQSIQKIAEFLGSETTALTVKRIYPYNETRHDSKTSRDHLESVAPRHNAVVIECEVNGNATSIWMTDELRPLDDETTHTIQRIIDERSGSMLLSESTYFRLPTAGEKTDYELGVEHTERLIRIAEERRAEVA